jgi:hypothetical protein
MLIRAGDREVLAGQILQKTPCAPRGRQVHRDQQSYENKYPEPILESRQAVAYQKRYDEGNAKEYRGVQQLLTEKGKR